MFLLQTNATVENAVIKDAFSRSVLLYKSDVGMKNVAVERSPGRNSFINLIVISIIGVEC